MNENQVFAPVLSSWLAKDGDDADVIISSRIRLARNIASVPFPVYQQDEKVIAKVANILSEKYLQLKMADISPLQRALLVEKHLISPYLMERAHHAAVFVNKEEDVSIMVNEEDHLRIQCLVPGLRMFDALEKALNIDKTLEKNISFAFEKELGYLTSCITNIGTGLRASVMVYLPGLVRTKRIRKVTEAIRSLGFVVRGMYGEGSQAASHIFQISNQVTLGLTEEEIVEDLTQIIEQLIMQERVARTNLKQKFHIALEDQIYRAYGLLKFCRVISSEESADAISKLRLGIELGFIEHITRQKMNELILFSQPAFLRRYAGGNLDELEEKVVRASVIRSILKEL